MLTVGIKELKAKLSSYVEKVGAGEEVVVTDHGKEVALLVPISKERQAVRALMDSGKVQWSGGKPKGTSGVRTKGKPLADTVLEERR
ncbi:MAG: prevent-host-death [Geobacteraceae bacterium]|nr:MAG: prevent-host-death [Geobacteraceae bacterium]